MKLQLQLFPFYGIFYNECIILANWCLFSHRSKCRFSFTAGSFSNISYFASQCYKSLYTEILTVGSYCSDSENNARFIHLIINDNICFYIRSLCLQGSDIETLGSEVVVEYGTELLERHLVEETKLQDAKTAASAGRIHILSLVLYKKIFICNID